MTGVQTCALPICKNKPGVQIFSWSGSKTGGWNPGMYSEPNAETIDALMTQWLYRNLYLLVTCQNVPVCTFCPPEINPRKNTWKLELKFTYQIPIINRDKDGKEIGRRYVTYDQLSPNQKAKFDKWWDEQMKKGQVKEKVPKLGENGAQEKADAFLANKSAGDIALS